MANILVPRANNPLTKNSATNVKNTTAVKTPTVTQSNQYMSVNPNIEQIKKQVAAKNNVQSTVIPQNTQTVQNQTTAPVTNTANTSRFIGLNQSTYNPWNNTLQMQQQAQPIVDANKNKQKLIVPTAVSETKKFNEAEEKKWRTGEQAIMDFQVDVMKNRGKMSEDTIKRLYPEFKDNISSAMELQKELYPIVQSGMGVEASQISQFYPELLAEQKKAAKSIEETQKDVEKANKDSKKFYDRIRKTNLDVLSANGKELANYMLYLEQIPNQLKRKYNINSDASDQEIINYYLSNNPEELEEFNRISNLKLSSYDKAQLGLGGNWMDKFSAGVQRFFNNASNAYQENVAQPLSDVPLIGSLAQVPGGVLQGPNKTLTNMAQLRNGEFNSASDIVGAGIKAGGGALETTFNTAYAPLTAAFNVVGESEVGQKIEENTIGLVPRAITWTFENTPLLKDFYNSLDEEARADLSNELTIALLHGAGSAAKKSGLDIKAGVAAEAVVNALQRGKYASKFQIWLEKGMADENGKFQKGALGRVTKEGWNEFKDALEENFNRFDEVVKAREDLRNPKPTDNTNLPDNRTTGEKIKSEVGNAVEKVKDSVKKANEKAKEKYSNLINNRSKAQEGQGLQSESTLGESKINGNNGSQSGGEINSKPLNKVQTQLIQNYNRMNPKYIQDFEKRYGENYGKFLADRGFTKAGEDNLNDLIDYKEQLLDIKSDAITKIEGKFQDQAITDMLDHLVDFYEKTKNRKMLQEFKPMQEQLQREGLTMAQTEKIRKKYSYDIRTEFLKDQANTEKIALANNIYLAMKDFLDKTAKENGLDSLDEINREIMKVQHIIGGITYKLRGSSANNSFTLTDWITAASAVSNPEALALLIGKQLLKKNSVRNKVLETLVGRRGNAKNRITSKTIESELERISEINDKKEQDRELTKFYNTYIKPVKELREAYENDVANFKKEFKESVEDGTLSNALEDKRTPEDKSKNQVYGDLTNIEVDEQGTSRRKGSLGEGDKRSDWNKKYGYENTDLAIPEKKTPTEKPTKPTNIVTNGKSKITDKKPAPRKSTRRESTIKKIKEKIMRGEEVDQDILDSVPELKQLYESRQKAINTPGGALVYTSGEYKYIPSVKQGLIRLSTKEGDKMLTDNVESAIGNGKKIRFGYVDEEGYLDQFPEVFIIRDGENYGGYTDVIDSDNFNKDNLYIDHHDNKIRFEDIDIDGDTHDLEFDLGDFLRDVNFNKLREDKPKEQPRLDLQIKNKVTAKKEPEITEFFEEIDPETEKYLSEMNKDAESQYELNTMDLDVPDELIDEINNLEIEKDIKEQQQDLKDMPETEDIEYLDMAKNNTEIKSEPSSPTKIYDQISDQVKNHGVKKGVGALGNFKSKEYTNPDGTVVKFTEGPSTSVTKSYFLTFKPKNGELTNFIVQKIGGQDPTIRLAGQSFDLGQEAINRLQRIINGEDYKKVMESRGDNRKPAEVKKEEKTVETNKPKNLVTKPVKEPIKKFLDDYESGSTKYKEELSKEVKWSDPVGDNDYVGTVADLVQWAVDNPKAHMHERWNGTYSITVEDRYGIGNHVFDTSKNNGSVLSLPEEAGTYATWLKNNPSYRLDSVKPRTIKDFIEERKGEEDFELKGTKDFEEGEFSLLPEDESVAREMNKPKNKSKRIAPDRVPRQQLTKEEGVNNMLEGVKAIVEFRDLSPRRYSLTGEEAQKYADIKKKVQQFLYSNEKGLGFKSTRGNKFNKLWESIGIAKKNGGDLMEKQLKDIAEGLYIEQIKKDIGNGYMYPKEILDEVPGAKTAKDKYEAYIKGWNTSFSKVDERKDTSLRDTIGSDIKRQDGKEVTQEFRDYLRTGLTRFGKALGVDVKKLNEDLGLIYIDLNGKNPFLMKNIAGLYTHATRSLSVHGSGEKYTHKGEDGKMVTDTVQTTLSHELTHAIDHIVNWKLIPSDLKKHLTKVMNPAPKFMGAKYWENPREVTARMVEEYVAVKEGVGDSYYDRGAYWNKEIFEKEVAPAVEKAFSDKLGDYHKDPGTIKYQVLSNSKNKVTSRINNNLARQGLNDNQVNYLVNQLKKTGLAKDVKMYDNIDGFYDELNSKGFSEDAEYIKDYRGDISGAVTPDGVVHLIKDNLRRDTPTHEFSHLLRSYAKENNPDLFNAINKVAKEAPKELKEYVENTYGELSEDALLDEVFAWRQGEFSGIKTAQKWYQRMWEAIKRVWNNIKSKFGKDYADLDVFKAWEKMGSDEIMNKIDSVLKGGKEIKNEGATKDLDYSDPKFQSVYHGSHADFDRFDSSHMGEGEGNQAHGRGHYVAVDKGTAERYAEIGAVKYKGKQVGGYDNLTSNLDNVSTDERSMVQSIAKIMQKEKKTVKEAKAEVLNRWEGYLKEDESRLQKAKQKGNDNDVKEIQKFVDRSKNLIDTIKNIDEKDFNYRNLYTNEIPDPVKADTPTGSNYLEEKGALTKDQRKDFYQKLNKIHKNMGDDLERRIEDWIDKKYERGDGETFYHAIVEWLDENSLGGEKEASQLLNKMGYDGIHYFGGRDGEAYVIFNDNALQIKDHVKYQKNKSTANDKNRVTNGGSKIRFQRTEGNISDLDPNLRNKVGYNYKISDANDKNIHGLLDYVLKKKGITGYGDSLNSKFYHMNSELPKKKNGDNMNNLSQIDQLGYDIKDMIIYWKVKKANNYILDGNSSDNTVYSIKLGNRGIMPHGSKTLYNKLKNEGYIIDKARYFRTKRLKGNVKRN